MAPLRCPFTRHLCCLYHLHQQAWHCRVCWFELLLLRGLSSFVGCRSGQGRPSGLLKGHPAKLLKSSRVKPSGAVFDRTKLRDMYKTEMQCETPTTPGLCVPFQEWL